MTPVYIELFHGRTSPSQELTDWGLQGPILGPIRCGVHVTYKYDIKLGIDDDWTGELHYVEDLIYYNGIYYGDWSIIIIDIDTLSEGTQRRIAHYNPEYAKPPEGAVLASPSAYVRQPIASQHPPQTPVVRTPGTPVRLERMGIVSEWLEQGDSFTVVLPQFFLTRPQAKALFYILAQYLSVPPANEQSGCSCCRGTGIVFAHDDPLVQRCDECCRYPNDTAAMIAALARGPRLDEDEWGEQEHGW